MTAGAHRIPGSRSNGTKNEKVLLEVWCPMSSCYKRRERMKWARVDRSTPVILAIEALETLRASNR
jgi:hypothetical protein